MSDETAASDEASAAIPPGKAKLSRLAWWWAGAIAIAFAFMWIASWFDDATELTPDHSDVLDYCFAAAGFMAAASALMAFLQTKGAMAARIGLALCFALEAGLATSLFSITAAEIVENRVDFPAASTKTFGALLPVGRAYRADSRTGSSWTIQPVIWTNIDIAQSDYRFMLSREGWTGQGSEPKSVSSHGYFCAKVVMQQSGDALRVLHAGRFKLPPGTIGVCSQMVAKNPSLPVVS